MLAIFLDQETTGLDAKKHKVIDIAFKIIDVATGEEKCTYQSHICIPFSEWEARDPQSIEINGFTWDKILKGKSPDKVGEEIQALFKQYGIVRGRAFFVCQNPSFDRAFFAQLVDVYVQENYQWPYHWLDFASMYWALLVQKNRKEGLPIPHELSLSKNSIADRFHLPPETHPHCAINGVNHLLLCYRTVVGF